MARTNEYLNRSAMNRAAGRRKVRLILGGILSGFFAISVVLALTNYNQAIHDGLIIYVLCLIPSLYLLWSGIRLGREIELARRYNSIFACDKDGEVTMNELSQQAGKPSGTVLLELENSSARATLWAVRCGGRELRGCSSQTRARTRTALSRRPARTAAETTGCGGEPPANANTAAVRCVDKGERKMKKLRLWLLALALILGLSACGGDSELSFTNELSSVIHNVYINSIDNDTWGDPVTYAKLGKGNTIYLEFEQIGGGPGRYDIGVIDENAINYDAYDVDLAMGDAIAVSGTSSAASFTVTHADGSADSYDAVIYESES